VFGGVVHVIPLFPPHTWVEDLCIIGGERGEWRERERECVKGAGRGAESFLSGRAEQIDEMRIRTLACAVGALLLAHGTGGQTTANTCSGGVSNPSFPHPTPMLSAHTHCEWEKAVIYCFVHLISITSHKPHSLARAKHSTAVSDNQLPVILPGRFYQGGWFSAVSCV
jgi:hypothetical protein